ncbi:RNA-directed DNA polymerase [Methylocapsa acidiphila]|uniref:RNA-directed DNA polymerase n=1 Tax=Methylocapsa acidiphila TaxID=133552 RepID=UPI000429E7EE|nr:RNA-directed DNA polymerase [Methylocapsa acidiphila]
MSTLEKIFELGNLRRAYRWILSNPDARYKALFRDSYAAFALSSDTMLRQLRKDGLSNRYIPNHASKVMVPKPSGTLRPLTLLTIEDQIVYQACVNIISDLLKHKTKHRYRKRVFAHLYAGKSSVFFYFKWQDSYRLMARTIRELHSNRFTYVANFDLAAFYDSIDHHVLKHFLKDVGLDEDAIKILMQCLRQWTSSTWSTGRGAIYHEHGIPQGPLSSGMLSEVVLQHIDKAGERGSNTRYIRYVDDIKIFAKSEDVLRRKLIALDLSSKEVGLFPQTSKINIRRITNPNDEIKSVSRPPEPSIRPVVNQKKLASRLLEITRRSRVDPLLSTRFKYLIAQARPNYRLSERLLKVIKRHPEYSGAISSYFSRYKVIPTRLAAEITTYLKEPELYHSVTGDILRACLGRMSSTDSAVLGHFAAQRLLRPARSQLPLQPTYKEALIAWAIQTKAITFREMETLRDSETDWWVRKCILRELTADQFGTPSYRDFLNKSMRIQESEITRCAAARLAEEAILLDKPHHDIFESAKMILKTFKLIRSVGKPPSMINSVIAYVLKRPETDYNWITLFGTDHKHAEQMAIFIKQTQETDIDAFMTRLDSFYDKTTEVVFRRICPGKIYPKYGVALKHPTLVSLLPKTMKAFEDLHSLRLESFTAHPRSAKSAAGTRRLKHRDFHKLRPALVAAFDELEHIVV